MEKTNTHTDIYSLHIVGARHHLKGEMLDKWLDTAVGSTISIIPEPKNLCDPFALGAWAWIGDSPRKVGYVGNEDRTMAYRLLLAAGGKRLRMSVTGRRENGTTLLAGIRGIEPVAEEAVELAPKWQAWKSPVEPMPMPQEMELEEFIADDVTALLEQGAPAAEIASKLNAYIKYSFYDLSLETRQARGSIIRLLKSRDDAGEWKVMVNELYGEYGRTGTEAVGGKIWEKWTGWITHPDYAAVLSKGQLPSKQEVDKALYDFPLDLWGAWLNNREKFFARLYYACIPRKVLWSFVSTLAVHEMLTSTDATNGALLSWANQAYLMPDGVVEGFYDAMEWLSANGYDVAHNIVATLTDEIRRRQQAERQ